MFPAIPLPSFEQSVPPQRLDSQNIDDIFRKFGFAYSVGLFRQITSLYDISAKLFLELENDFNALQGRMDSISQRVSSFRAKADKVIEQNAALSAVDFSNRGYAENQMPQVSQVSGFMLSRADTFVQPLLDHATPAPSLKAFASIIPDYQQLDKMISDPTQFEKQYKEEMLQILVGMTEKLKNKRQKHSKPENTQTDNIGSTVLHSYIETVQPPQQTLLVPPPPGQTSGWRNSNGQESAYYMQNPSWPTPVISSFGPPTGYLVTESEAHPQQGQYQQMQSNYQTQQEYNQQQRQNYVPEQPYNNQIQQPPPQNQPQLSKREATKLEKENESKMQQQQNINQPPPPPPAQAPAPAPDRKSVV